MDSLRRQLDLVMLRDRARLARELARPDPDPSARERVAKAIAESVQRREQRMRSVPELRIDESLPIAAHAEQLIEMIREHRIIVVAGETGSGKTTQLPKLCLAAGRGSAGLIGCTQPRRVAARSVANRVASELQTPLGALVGYQVRFTDQVSDSSLIKFMTDGILLAETQKDRDLLAYDTLIIDEAHERSLNIDFLLGYLKRLSARRPDLRIIVTSATIDTERFSEFFGVAPVLSVEGRGHPVELRWRPVEDEDAALGDHLVQVMDQITAEDPQGDVLVFLPGEREIRDAHLALARRKYRATDVLPLYARLSVRDQDRVFNPGPGRRIVLATNVAETSLTVPRIRWVVDSGLARISRYSVRSKLQRLQIEPVSQASANQRAGRCGRIGPGICVRLYSEDDYNARPAFGDPEILRSSLANVILRMLSLRLGEPQSFDFLDPPEERAWRDGFQTLSELGAVDRHERLTETGRQLARWPIDVRIARMLLAAKGLGSLPELLVIGAFLSIQDPRERPGEQRQAADAAHAQFVDARSDFVSVLQLWTAWQNAHEELTQSRLREWCQQHFLSFMRMREWRELHRQLLLLCREQKWPERSEAPAEYESLHRALIAGLPTQIGQRDPRGHYVGTRQRQFHLFPGAAPAKKPPPWVMAATLLDTHKVFAIMAAQIEPEWVEREVPHLLKRRVFDPHWDRKNGHVRAFESVSLMGLILVHRRAVQFASHDPVEAHRVFVIEAIARDELGANLPFVAHNRRVLEEARAIERKLRREGLVADENALAAWFATRVPADICSRAGIEAWYRRADKQARKALELSTADVIDAQWLSGARAGFPDTLALGAQTLRLHYRFDPQGQADGISLDLPLDLLNAMDEDRLGWLVPGLRLEKAVALIKSLPKSIRRNVVPAPDFARAFLEAAVVEGSFERALAAFLSRVAGLPVDAGDFDSSTLGAHLVMNVRVIDADRKLLAESRSFPELRQRFAQQAREAFARRVAGERVQDGLRQFPDEPLPREIQTPAGLPAFPALIDCTDAVGVRVFENRAHADAMHAAGVGRLLNLRLADRIRQLQRQIPLTSKAALAWSAIGSREQLAEDIVGTALLECLRALDLVGVRDRAQFEETQQKLASALGRKAGEISSIVCEVLVQFASLQAELAPPLIGFAAANLEDARKHLLRLLGRGFVSTAGSERLRDYPRYLKGVQVRLQRLRQDPGRDQQRLLELLPFEQSLARLEAQAQQDAAARLRWLLEEYRVSLFAQELGTRESVSAKRLQKAFESALTA